MPSSKKTKKLVKAIPPVTVASLNANQPAMRKNAQKQQAKRKAKAGKTTSKVAAATTSTSTSTAGTTKQACSLNPNFAVTSTHNAFISATHVALVALAQGIVVQNTNNAINFACSNHTGRPNCRVGGYYLYNGVLQLQCRWLQPAALAYIKKHGLVIVNAAHLLAKSNNLQLPVVNAQGTLHKVNAQHAAQILALQAAAYKQGIFTNSNHLLN